MFELLNQAYGGDAFSRTQCYEWFTRCKNSRRSIEDDRDDPRKIPGLGLDMAWLRLNRPNCVTQLNIRYGAKLTFSCPRDVKRQATDFSNYIILSKSQTDFPTDWLKQTSSCLNSLHSCLEIRVENGKVILLTLELPKLSK
ncbi:hypothetical protein WN55_01767 [Dufourea novaeangliae]|uniref:Mos1 transposase HTH domain-containing protein n=1 Tax=Dufourea novaeangliae TaxID=178035 RepID=A0A154NVY8_DUFNO|nr:hypothetical protein WN55_01767 [Dufourea novaeangliae]